MKKLADKESTAQKVFEVSLQLFVQRGYGNTTIRDIAAAADISTGLLFHYYPSKQALLEAHLHLAAQGMDEALLILRSKQQPIKIFDSIARLTLGSMHTPVTKNIYALMNQPLPANAVPENLRKKINKTFVIDSSIPIIKKGQLLGEVKEGSAEALALCFWGSIQGVAEILALNKNLTPPDPVLLLAILQQSKT